MPTKTEIGLHHSHEAIHEKQGEDSLKDYIQNIENKLNLGAQRSGSSASWKIELKGKKQLIPEDMIK